MQRLEDLLHLHKPPPISVSAEQLFNHLILGLVCLAAIRSQTTKVLFRASFPLLQKSPVIHTQGLHEVLS